MLRIAFIAATVIFVVLLSSTVAAQSASSAVPAGAKVFVSPMDGFETYLKEAIAKKKVPLQIVDQKDQADFELTGRSESQPASTAKKVLLWNWQSREEASINLVNLKTSEVAFAYSVHKENSAHGKRSSAEACAKHLKEKIESKQ